MDAFFTIKPSKLTLLNNDDKAQHDLDDMNDSDIEHEQDKHANNLIEEEETASLKEDMEIEHYHMKSKYFHDMTDAIWTSFKSERTSFKSAVWGSSDFVPQIYSLKKYIQF